MPERFLVIRCGKCSKLIAEFLTSYSSDIFLANAIRNAANSEFGDVISLELGVAVQRSGKAVSNVPEYNARYARCECEKE